MNRSNRFLICVLLFLSLSLLSVSAAAESDVIPPEDGGESLEITDGSENSSAPDGPLQQFTEAEPIQKPSETPESITADPEPSAEPAPEPAPEPVPDADASYSIAYDANGGTGAMRSQSDLSLDRSHFLAFSSFKREGYSFTGWNTAPDGSGTAYANRARISDPPVQNGGVLTLYAQWALTPYRIIYRNVTSSDDNPNPPSYVFGLSVPLVPLSRVGYTFDGWYAESAFRTPVTAVNASLTDTGSVTVYAKWTQLKYNIVFDANSLGRGTVSGSMRPMTNRLCGKTYSLSSNAFRMDGYSFLGWSTDPYASVPLYANRERITNLTLEDGATVTLYAVWQANSLRFQ